MKMFKKYGLREDLRYWLWYKWKCLFQSIYGILIKDHVLNDMHWRSYLESHGAFADMQAGRFYEDEEDQYTKTC